jgi:hypothetical protein
MTAPLKGKRIYLVNRDFQFRYMRAAVVVGVFSTLLTSGLILYPLYVFKILVIPRFLPTPILLAMALAALANMVFIGLLAVLLTHRIAGPMYSLARQMREVASGNWRSWLSLRKHDDLKYVMRNFNELIEGLIATGREDIRTLDELQRQVGRILEAGGIKDSPEVHQAFKEYRERLVKRIGEDQTQVGPSDGVAK